MFKYVALFFAFIAIFSFASAACTDSDSGNNFFVKGTVTAPDRFGTPRSSTDSCSGQLLTEYYCTGGAFTSTSFNCEANGYKCVDGACQRQAGDEYCQDNDAGIDSRVRGKIKWVEADGSEKDAMDECSGDVLMEYFCDRRRHSSMQISCRQESQNFVCFEGRCVHENQVSIGCSPGSRRCSADGFKLQLCSKAGYWLDEAVCSGGCIGGQCLQAQLGQPGGTKTTTTEPPQEPYCQDTDLGKNYEKLGRVFGMAGDGSLFEKPDACANNTDLVEFFCDGSEHKSEKFSCSSMPGYRCSDGRCRLFETLKKASKTTAMPKADLQQQTAQPPEEKVEVFNLRKLVEDFHIGTFALVLVIAAVFYFLGRVGK